MPRPRSLAALCLVGHTQRKAESKRARCSPMWVVRGGGGGTPTWGMWQRRGERPGELTGEADSVV